MSNKQTNKSERKHRKRILARLKMKYPKLYKRILQSWSFESIINWKEVMQMYNYLIQGTANQYKRDLSRFEFKK